MRAAQRVRISNWRDPPAFAPVILLGRPLMSLLPLCLRFFYALGYGSRHGLNCALCAFGQISDRVGCNWNLLCCRISGDCSHEAKLAHNAPDEKKWHSDKATPKQTRRAAATKGREKADHADDGKNEADCCDNRACDAQK